MTVSVMVAIRERFIGRILEWYVAAQLLLWGLILLYPVDIFSTSVGFANFNVTQAQLGQAMLLLGVIRVGALIINGAIPNVTPFFRIGGAVLGCGVWFYISTNLLSTGHIGTWIAAWPMACVAEFVNMYRASHDARAGVRRVANLKRAQGAGGWSR